MKFHNLKKDKIYNSWVIAILSVPLYSHWPSMRPNWNAIYMHETLQLPRYKSGKHLIVKWLWYLRNLHHDLRHGQSDILKQEQQGKTHAIRIILALGDAHLLKSRRSLACRLFLRGRHRLGTRSRARLLLGSWLRRGRCTADAAGRALIDKIRPISVRPGSAAGTTLRPGLTRWAERHRVGSRRHAARRGAGWSTVAILFCRGDGRHSRSVVSTGLGLRLRRLTVVARSVASLLERR